MRSPPRTFEIYGAPDDADAARRRLRGSVVSYENPADPAFKPGEWEMNR